MSLGSLTIAAPSHRSTFSADTTTGIFRRFLLLHAEDYGTTSRVVAISKMVKGM
ncbi:hypothetical protein GcM1_167012 [Golovinomyces cichoracearum]|uniref:Uncharacterized protein n=1 Tax=Golovinomyces cichoracearum TaxID=62708 RepID=A0A420J7N3_9PEZI|nr:hypothetical protein GcM1_167012 [Golovinomyces cichoracearum]